MKEKLADELLKKSVDRKITCAAARGLAEELGVSYAEIGAVADELGIKIHSCQLGCF